MSSRVAPMSGSNEPGSNNPAALGAPLLPRAALGPLAPLHTRPQLEPLGASALGTPLTPPRPPPFALQPNPSYVPRTESPEHPQTEASSPPKAEDGTLQTVAAIITPHEDTREPASIDALGSPAAAPSCSPRASKPAALLEPEAACSAAAPPSQPKSTEPQPPQQPPPKLQQQQPQLLPAQPQQLQPAGQVQTPPPPPQQQQQLQPALSQSHSPPPPPPPQQQPSAAPAQQATSQPPPPPQPQQQPQPPLLPAPSLSSSFHPPPPQSSQPQTHPSANSLAPTPPNPLPAQPPQPLQPPPPPLTHIPSPSQPQPPSLPGAIPGTPPGVSTGGAPASAPAAAPLGVVKSAASLASTPGVWDGRTPRVAFTPGGGGGWAAGPVPPSTPPPPSVLRDPSGPGTGAGGDLRAVEEYIPFGFVELRGSLIADHPQVFSQPGVRARFEELCRWMSLRNKLRLALDYGDAHEKYAPLDPDKDTLAFKASLGEACEVPGDAAAADAPPAQPKDLLSRVAGFHGELDAILEKAEFERLPPGDLEKAKNDKSLMGVDVTTVSDEYLDYRLFYRGSRTKKIQWLRWGLFKRQIEMNVYERLAIAFRLKKPVSRDDVPAEGGTERFRVPWYKQLLGLSGSNLSALHELRDEFLYLKLFRDVLQCDVDTLLPGAVVRFTAWDYLSIWLPILVGCGCAVWKAVQGTINFSNMRDALLSVVLIVMPLTWGVRAWLATREKQRLHVSHLHALLLTHSLNNNAGVISQLLDEAQEQEDNEAMLAYFFLWRGQAVPQPLRKIELDRAVEAYLQRKLDDAGTSIRMDYEVVDSIGKLERMGLLHTVVGAAGERCLQVLPLDAAVEQAHVRHFSEGREAGQASLPRAKSKRYGPLSLVWHECVDVFKPTGQQFRYWWNAATGETSYFEPDEPYIKLSTAAALDLAHAAGNEMRDPNKYSLAHSKTS